MAPRAKVLDYGIDAPGLVRGFLVGGLCALILNVVVIWFFSQQWPWGALVIGILSLVAAYLLFMGGLMIFWSRVTKVHERDALLDQLTWRGDETVLDVGCGRGLMLIGAARRLTTGKAIGIDIWQATDQSDNTPDGAIRNGSLEGVSERIEIQTADMRALPFPDKSIDVVMSHWAVHNLEDASDRDLALSEIARVLRHDGTVVIADIENRDAYMQCLRQLGFVDQILIVKNLRDVFLGTISFGSFKPFALVAKRGR